MNFIGTPRTHWSNYSMDRLNSWAHEVKAHSDNEDNTFSWIIFDNTAAGCAALTALQMRDLLG